MLFSHWLLAVLGLSPLVLVARTGREARPEEAAEAPAGDLSALVLRIQAGESAAESELVARFSHGLLLMLRRLVRNPALADDLHQETFALVLAKVRRGEVREPERLPGFLRSTARNLFIADRRKEARYRALDEDAEHGLHPAPALADRGPAPLERVLAEEEAGRCSGSSPSCASTATWPCCRRGWSTGRSSACVPSLPPPGTPSQRRRRRRREVPRIVEK
jgi:hypothetical protein